MLRVTTAEVMEIIQIISLLIIGHQATVVARILNYSHSTIIILNNLLEIYNTSFDLE
jgi:hypothetical protein